MTYEEKYFDRVRKQQQKLEEFVAHEKEWGNDLIRWYKARGQEMDDDVYRAILYFRYDEFLKTPIALSLLYTAYNEVHKELMKCRLEDGFAEVVYRFRTYYLVLKKEGIIND
jgi:hypothetical protein